jgi:DNA polymerase III delta subunit
LIYHRQKIDNLAGLFDICSVVVLHGENYNYMLRDAKKIAEEIAGPDAYGDMRINSYFNQEIYSKRDEIISCLKTKSFFSGRQIIMLNGFSEKDYKIITEIDTEWQSHDAVTIVTMNELIKNSEIKKLLASSTRVALVNYTKRNINSEFFQNKLAEEGINFHGKEILDTLVDFANFTPEDILENELEKLKLFKLYDDKPLSIDDFFNIVSINYETNELSIAVALAERNVMELEKSLSALFSQGKNSIPILQFISAYFNKLTLIKLFGASNFKVRREYPFLVSNDLERAKTHTTKWTSEQLKIATNSLATSDLRLRKYPSFYHRSILNQCFHKIMEI